MQNPLLFISCKSAHFRLGSGRVKCPESTDMSCSMRTRPKVLYKQAKVALDSQYGSHGKNGTVRKKSKILLLANLIVLPPIKFNR